MLRKSPASNAWAEIFKNAAFSYGSLKVAKLSKFEYRSYLKLFSVFIISGSTILFGKHRRFKR